MRDFWPFFRESHLNLSEWILELKLELTLEKKYNLVLKIHQMAKSEKDDFEIASGSGVVCFYCINIRASPGGNILKLIKTFCQLPLVHTFGGGNLINILEFLEIKCFG